MNITNIVSIIASCATTIGVVFAAATFYNAKRGEKKERDPNVSCIMRYDYDKEKYQICIVNTGKVPAYDVYLQYESSIKCMSIKERNSIELIEILPTYIAVLPPGDTAALWINVPNAAIALYDKPICKIDLEYCSLDANNWKHRIWLLARFYKYKKCSIIDIQFFHRLRDIQYTDMIDEISTCTIMELRDRVLDMHRKIMEMVHLNKLG